ncbi:hypothetical protein ACVDFE_30620 [Lentzea chajnantorensis]
MPGIPASATTPPEANRWSRSRLPTNAGRSSGSSVRTRAQPVASVSPSTRRSACRHCPSSATSPSTSTSTTARTRSTFGRRRPVWKQLPTVERAGHSLRGRPAPCHDAWMRRVISVIDGLPASTFNPRSCTTYSSSVRGLLGVNTERPLSELGTLVSR